MHPQQFVFSIPGYAHEIVKRERRLRLQLLFRPLKAESLAATSEIRRQKRDATPSDRGKRAIPMARA
jgi:hypothetical protein